MKYLHFLLMLIIMSSSCKKHENEPIEEDPFLQDSGEFTDIRDEHSYKWVRIGEQIWMAEDLSASKYNDGTPIPEITPDVEWDNLESGAYCFYANDETILSPYGKLYNWYAVNTGKLAPKGWHIPTDDEWEQLAQYISDQNGPYDQDGLYWYDVGKHLKANTGWYNGGNGSNDYNFSAFPEGYRYYYGDFYDSGKSTSWWSTTETSPPGAWIRRLVSHNANFYRFSVKLNNAFSVRCIKD